MLKPLIALSAAVALMAATPVRADDDVPVKELPAAVVKAIGDRFPDAELIRAEWEDDQDEQHYEVDIRQDGKRYEVEVTREGKILDIDDDD